MHTRAGAEAFLRFFFDQLNVAWTTPDAHALDGLCLASSKACQGLRDIAGDLAAKKQHYSTTPVDVREIDFTVETQGSWRFQVSTVQNAAKIIDSAGTVHGSETRSDVVVAAYLRWRSSGWALTEFKVVS